VPVSSSRSSESQYSVSMASLLESVDIRFSNYTIVITVGCAGQPIRGTFSIMGRQSLVETRFRKRVRNERTRRGWSQADLSKRLQDKGLQHLLPSTVAKIENGDRAVRIDEANALADLFALSLDELLGRNLPERDLTSTLQAFLDTARSASVQLSAIEASLGAQSAELAAFEFQGRDTMVAGCDRVRDVLTKASDVLLATTRVRSEDLHDAATNLWWIESMKRVFPQWFDDQGRMREGGEDEAQS
jgi:transcriptional regulator with XRE-family HTH domain